MASIAKLIRNRLFAVSRRVWPVSLAVFTCMLAVPSLVHAHGMGGAELGPPILTSGLLGLVCYWLVILWPSAKRKGVGSSGQNRDAPQTVRIKRKPRLRIIETPSHSHSDQSSGRRAGNG